MELDPAAQEQYWDKKIQKWAHSSYDAERNALLDRLRTSIDARKDTTLELIKAHVKPGGFLVDLGCGGGQFAIEAVRRGLVDRAVGVDIAASGVAMGNDIAKELGLSDKVRFEKGSCVEFPVPAEATIITGLGLVDWLDHDLVRKLFRLVKGRKFVISFSEQDNSFQEIVHRLWLCERLKWFGGGVRAWHHKRSFISGIARSESGVADCRFVRNKAMRFGALAHNLT